MPFREDSFNRILEKSNSNEIIESKIIENIELEPVSADPSEAVKDISILEEKYRDAVPHVKEIVSKRVERGGISAKVKKFNEYKCQICQELGENPFTFRKVNGEYYIETHHIIPVSNMERGVLGILNLITVCPNHHRQLHYGDVDLINNEDDFLVYRIGNRKLKISKFRLDVK